MGKELNMVICGLSSQGIVMAGKILSTALLADGNNVGNCDVPSTFHRLGLTMTHVRAGDEIYSPITCEGGANLG